MATSGLPWTISRVTQFYDYILAGVEKLSRLPLASVPAGFRVQPIDPDEVTARLVELALGPSAGQVPDLSGPQVTDWVELSRDYLRPLADAVGRCRCGYGAPAPSGPADFCQESGMPLPVGPGKTS